MNELETLAARLRRLERQNTILKCLVLALLAGVPTFTVLAAQQNTSSPDTIRANRFEIVRNGRVQAVMTSDDNGGIVEVWRASGEVAGYIRSTKDGGSLDISDKTGKTVGFFDATASQGGVLAVSAVDNQDVVILRSNAGGDGVVELRQSYLNKQLGNSRDAEVELQAGLQGRLYLRHQGTPGVVLEGDFHSRGGSIALMRDGAVAFAQPPR
ncbi:MAG TPA: hypothetical protein VFA59_18570 [Vicinamibacterales bacterium]|nr:hypothetical protein [Vicinamibacterales bacterium]